MIYYMPMCLNASESDLSFTMLLIALLISGAPRTETSIPVMQSGVSEEARLRQVVTLGLLHRATPNFWLIWFTTQTQQCGHK